jgi:transposase
METLPGEEAQVDFGTGSPVRTTEGKTRRPRVFRIVLSYSRKAYSEAVWHQSSEAFIQCLENAFRHFGGVPKDHLTCKQLFLTVVYSESDGHCDQGEIKRFRSA